MSPLATDSQKRRTRALFFSSSDDTGASSSLPIRVSLTGRHHASCHVERPGTSAGDIRGKVLCQGSSAPLLSITLGVPGFRLVAHEQTNQGSIQLSEVGEEI